METLLLKRQLNKIRFNMEHLVYEIAERLKRSPDNKKIEELTDL